MSASSTLVTPAAPIGLALARGLQSVTDTLPSAAGIAGHERRTAAVEPAAPTSGARPRGCGAAWSTKRAIDVVGALLGLVMVAAMIAFVALAVRIEGGPGVIFRQQRVGKGGRTFTLYKLRSLRPVADEGDVRWNIDNDSHLGPVGRVIRKTSIDELPQLWNVLIGDMSLVGPRPERPYFVDQFSQTVPGYADRHRVPVGLTGLAVVNGLRGDTSIPDRVHYDNLYADSWSLWLDVKIVLRTIRYLVVSGA